MRGTDVIEAVVQAGDTETRYLRCGTGPVLLVIASDDAVRLALVRTFARTCRVIAPTPAAAADAAWLSLVADGLGLGELRLVCTDEHEQAVRAFCELREGSEMTVLTVD